MNGECFRGGLTKRIPVVLGLGMFLFIYGCAAPPSDVPDPGGGSQDPAGTDPGTDPGSGTKPTATPTPTPTGTQTVQYNFGFSKRGQGQVQPSAGVYDAGTTITVTAIPETGWLFDHWEGDLAGTANSATITMDANKYAVAVFAEQGQVATPVLSVATNTHFIDKLDVEISCPTPDAEIYYTLDESEPTASSIRYTGTIHLTGSATVKARAFKINMRASEIVSADYYAMQVPGS